MACSRCSAQLLRVSGLPVKTISRAVSTTHELCGKRTKEPVLRKWGLEKFPKEDNYNRLRPLLELPDFTYLDGRPTPLTKQQLERKEMNYNLTKRIVMLTKEMEEAKIVAVKRKQGDVKSRESILTSKLKPKSTQL
ncbi:large ribosomal subunit protein mL52-like isoform X1 [Littorina saxatilis]|uniref:Large ribosomal subunit protein mL52 n=1 Tax=Littorina saxatilis TaxID=31220 RepID=A0AAN9GM46_9CAEN